MTIDEAIEQEKFKARVDRIKANKRIFHNNDEDEISACNRSSEEHEQLAEWLEELKEYKQKPEGWMWDEAERNGYNKAIDDFASKLKAKCDGMIKDKWNSNVAPVSWAEAYSDFKDDIDEIAEQLKAGGENA